MWRDEYAAVTVGTVEPDAMSDLIELALDRIQDAQFLSTVGFRDADPSWLRASLRRRLIADAAAGKYVHQLHHYPTTIGEWHLPEHNTLPIRPCLLGEFPTGQGHTTTPSNVTWEDDHLEEDNPRTFLRRRLELIERYGYPMALLWCSQASLADPRSQWTKPHRRQVAAFLAGAPY